MRRARCVPFARSLLLAAVAGGLVGGAWIPAARAAGDSAPAVPSEIPSEIPSEMPSRVRSDSPAILRPLTSPSLSHQSQLGLSILPGSGLRVLFPYQEGIYCGQPGKRVCSSRLPTYLELQPSFGVTAHWDLLIDLRLGLEADFARTHAFALAPGLRYWIDPQQRLKVFTTLQAAFDFTEQHTRALSGYDLAFHNGNGLMFEVMRDLGFYAQLGETIGFVRWLRFEVDVGAGVQARFP